MSNENQVTLRGWIGTEPKEYNTGETPFTTFRLSVTNRYYDRNKNEWAERNTNWYTVKSWRKLANLVGRELHKGDPVIVQGLLNTDTWEAEGTTRTDLVIEAQAIGKDLARLPELTDVSELENWETDSTGLVDAAVSIP